ncbi:MAG: hypothetical protein HYR76_00715 [Ignavibacteria bacterium]|nr:hypothetical protein [Ignavibacteria bacterium]
MQAPKYVLAQRQPEPIERYAPLFFKLSVYSFLSLFFYQAAITFYEYQPGMHWPAFLSVFRTYTFLPLHEGGHFLFSLFGNTLYLLGGSFWQIMFPLLWFLIAAKQRSHVAPFALFWTGENIMDVSLYVRDAQFRALPLLGGHSSGHDWVNLLTQWDAMDSASMIADLMYFGGMAISIGSIVTGIVLAFVVFFNPNPLQSLPDPAITSTERTIEENLNETLAKKEQKNPWFGTPR